MDALLSPENLQVAGLAVVSVCLIGLIYKLARLFVDALGKLDTTLNNHFIELSENIKSNTRVTNRTSNLVDELMKEFKK